MSASMQKRPRNISAFRSLSGEADIEQTALSKLDFCALATPLAADSLSRSGLVQQSFAGKTRRKTLAAPALFLGRSRRDCSAAQLAVPGDPSGWAVVPRSGGTRCHGSLPIAGKVTVASLRSSNSDSSRLSSGCGGPFHVVGYAKDCSASSEQCCP
jgi:hypothetical protein